MAKARKVGWSIEPIWCTAWNHTFLFSMIWMMSNIFIKIQRVGLSTERNETEILSKHYFLNCYHRWTIHNIACIFLLQRWYTKGARWWYHRSVSQENSRHCCSFTLYIPLCRSISKKLRQECQCSNNNANDQCLTTLLVQSSIQNCCWHVRSSSWRIWTHYPKCRHGIFLHVHRRKLVMTQGRLQRKVVL